MGSRATTSLAFFLALNLIFFTLVNACDDCPKPKPPPPACPPPPKTHTPKPPSPKPEGSCPIDTLKLAACVKVLGIGPIIIGSPPTKPCCPLIAGLADLEAAVCLCTAIKVNVLGIINLDVPVDLSVILNDCGKKCPSGFQCR